MILTEFRSEVRDRCGILASDPAATDSLVDALVRAAGRAFENENPKGWPWAWGEVAFSSVLDQEAYPFASIGANPFRKIAALWITPSSVSGRLELARVQRVQQIREYEATISYVPQTWAIDGSTLYLGPQPDGAYPLLARVQFVEPDLSAPTSTFTYIPVEWHSVIVEKAAELLFRRKHNADEARLCHAEYVDGVRKARQGAKSYGGPGAGVVLPSDVW